jgi:hypothetical protein
LFTQKRKHAPTHLEISALDLGCAYFDGLHGFLTFAGDPLFSGNLADAGTLNSVATSAPNQ